MIEAMLLARPALVCDVGGCAEFIRDGVEGFLAPSATPDHLAAAMDRAWTTRPTWPTLGAAARTRAQTLLGPDPARDFLNLLLSAPTAAHHPLTPPPPHPLTPTPPTP
jgi:glycosyltransferase involved in cell wall biosynthesis